MCKTHLPVVLYGILHTVELLAELHGGVNKVRTSKSNVLYSGAAVQQVKLVELTLVRVFVGVYDSFLNV